MDQSESESVLESKARSLVYTCPVDHVGTSLFVKGWVLPQSSKAPIILVHDLGESANNMEDIATQFSDKGYNVYSFDIRGHGQSGRRLGHISGFHQLTIDLLQVVAWVKHKEGGKKPIIAGQGFGALICMSFATSQAKFCQGLALISPMISLGNTIRPYQRFIISTLAEFFPTLMLPHSITPRFTYVFKKDKKKIKAQHKISALLTHEILIALSQSRKNFNRLNTNSLIICPSDDIIYRYEHIKKMVQKHKNNEKIKLEFINTNCHQMMSDDLEVIKTVVEHMTEWMEGGSSDDPNKKDDSSENHNKSQHAMINLTKKETNHSIEGL